MEFMKPCDEKFIETAEQFKIKTTKKDLDTLLRNDPKLNNEYRKFQIEIYNQYFKTNAFTVTNDTTENIKNFKIIIEKLIATSDDGKIRIIDRYVSSSLIENFIEYLPLGGLKHLEIFTSIMGMEKPNDFPRLLEKVNEFKETLLSPNNIKLEIKMSLSEYGGETLHHRTIQNNSMSYSIADGIDNIFRGQPLGYIQQLDESMFEESKQVWEEKWKVAADVDKHQMVIHQKILNLQKNKEKKYSK
jgi:hypothetical protein